MAAAIWQQASGAKKCENGRPKRSETDSPKVENDQKVQSGRKQAKSGEEMRQRSGCFLLIVLGHFQVAI